MRMYRYVIMVRSESARRLERHLGEVGRTMVIGLPGKGDLVMELVAITSDEFAPIMARNARQPIRHFPSTRVTHYLNLNWEDADSDDNFARCCGYNFRSLLSQGDLVTSVPAEATCRGRAGDGHWRNGAVRP